MPRQPGRPKLDADVIVIGGNRSRLTDEELEARRAEEAAKKPRPISPKKPADLSKVAAECWDQHAPELVRLGLLTVLDGAAFRLACESYALAVSALEELRPRKADGTVDKRSKGFEVVAPDPAHGGLKKHPGFAVFTAASAAYLKWCGEFGLTPISRQSLRPGRATTVPSEGSEGDGDGATSILGY